MPGRSTDTHETGEWTHDADVVCIGSGAAGLTAAVTAVGNGDSAIVLEKMPRTGGSTAESPGGVMWIPNHFALRERGIDDRREDCLRYLARFSYPEEFTSGHETLGLPPLAYELLEAFYDHGAAAIDRLRGLGALHVAAHPLDGDSESAPDYFDHAPEDKVWHGRTLTVVDAAGAKAGGAEMVRQLERYLRSAGVPILLQHRACELIQGPSGEVRGIECEHAGHTIRVRARKGVVLGTGGYSRNHDLVTRFQPHRLYGTSAAAGCTGDAIAIAARAGAMLGNMAGAWRAEVIADQAVESSELPFTAFAHVSPGDSKIMVNKYGRRVVNEFRNYNDRTKAHFTFDPTREEFPNQLLFLICDQRTVDIYNGAFPLSPGGKLSPYTIRSGTLDELAESISRRLASLRGRLGDITLAADFSRSLRREIARFNRFAQTGIDEDFGRGAQRYDQAFFWFFSRPRDMSAWEAAHLPNHTMFPISDVGPFYALILGAGALDTNGGPVIDSRAQVIDWSGAPIPGLYGAGNCIASPSREAYYGAGCTIGLAAAFGHIAANSAHQRG